MLYHRLFWRLWNKEGDPGNALRRNTVIYTNNIHCTQKYSMYSNCSDYATGYYSNYSNYTLYTINYTPNSHNLLSKVQHTRHQGLPMSGVEHEVTHATQVEEPVART